MSCRRWELLKPTQKPYYGQPYVCSRSSSHGFSFSAYIHGLDFRHQQYMMIMGRVCHSHASSFISKTTLVTDISMHHCTQCGKAATSSCKGFAGVPSYAAGLVEYVRIAVSNVKRPTGIKLEGMQSNSRAEHPLSCCYQPSHDLLHLQARQLGLDH